MNIIGELAFILGLTAIAGAIIGWCIKSFTGGSVKEVRQHFARDMDDAVEDARHLRHSLDKKKQELRETKEQLSLLRRKDSSAESGIRSQVGEINDLKKDLAESKKALLENQTEFNTFRNEKQDEHNQLRKELSKFSAGGSANAERLTEANETIAALRSAARENDKVIASLRARVKEADTGVENLRSQLKTSESGRNKVETVSLQYDQKVEELSKKLEQSNATVEKQKGDYDLMLENKNTDIKALRKKNDELLQNSTEFENRKKEFEKQTEELKLTDNKAKAEIVNLRRVISDRDTALSKTRQQVSELNSQINTIEQREKQEVSRLTTKVEESSKARTQIKSKSAEVAALNDMLRDSAGKRDSLQSDVNKLNETLTEKDTKITALRNDLDDVVASRNKVSTQLGELQTQGNLALEKLQQDLNQLAATRDEYKQRIDTLQAQVSELEKSKEKQVRELTDTVQATENNLNKRNTELERKNQTLKSENLALQNDVQATKKSRDEHQSRIGSLQAQFTELTNSKDQQLRELRTSVTETAKASESKLKSANEELANQNSSLTNELKALQAKSQDQTRTLEQLKSDIVQKTKLNDRLTKEQQESESSLSDLRIRLRNEESEKQRLNRDLTNAQALQLTLTDREAELKKVQLELKETNGTGGPMQKIIDEHVNKNDSLMSALRERDEEISRLNGQITNNRLRTKQQESSISLLTQEQESQSHLIKSLEKQAENTLQLNEKIARQSTELEELRARLFERQNRKQSSHSTASQTIGTVQSGLHQVETNRSSGSGIKPRVFVRADTEALTGATGVGSKSRPQFTLDGHRIRRPDGSDDLTLLPGINYDIAGAFSKNGVAEFEQIALWTQREVAHYAERVGVPVQSAEQYDWPRTARQILAGTYRKDGQEIGNP